MDGDEEGKMVEGEVWKTKRGGDNTGCTERKEGRKGVRNRATM